MAEKNIVLAGATGNLGERIARHLLKKKASVRAVLRPGTSPDRAAHLKKLGLSVIEADFRSTSDLSQAIQGADCVVSALSGLREVIVGAQSQLLHAAIKADIRRFIPSDYSIDFTKIPAGKNSNLDARREFKMELDKAPIAATSVLNGAFTDMLTGQAPLVLFKLRRVLYWGDADQKMDFTAIDDVADYTASAALDDAAPRFLKLAGDQISARDLVGILSEISGTPYRLLYGGSLTVLEALGKITKSIMPVSDELYPPWQGMQYLHNMYSGIAKFDATDNDRYFKKRWTSARDILSDHLAKKS